MASAAPDRATIDRRKGSYYSAAKVREAGEIEHLVGQVEDQEKRDALRSDLASFLLYAFPEAFPLPFSGDHLEVIAILQRVILQGGQFAVAMPRGYGKTTLATRSAIWGLLYGHRRSAVIVTAADPLALKLLRDIKTELRFNAQLAAMFPGTIAAIRHLEGRAAKANSQTFHGVPTGIIWKADELVFPQMEGETSSGARIAVAGITGGKIRGQNHTTQTGEIVRPDIVIVDDPQDRESAKSPTQTSDRLAVINGDIVGMAGPTRRISCVVPCTVIEEGDAADQLLDRSKNPQWNGFRTKALREWPANLAKWDEYREVRARGMREGMSPNYWNAFLREHWDELHAGAVPSWPERYKREDELSAVQSCMNWHFDSPEAFAAEGQNEPLKRQSNEIEELVESDVTDRAIGLPRRAVPVTCQRIMQYVDVQGKMLFYMTCAFDDDFSTHILDYGSYPDQKRSIYTLADAKRSLGHAFPGSSEESRIYEGLTALASETLGAVYRRQDGIDLPVERCLVDSGWQTETIYKWCRESPWRDKVFPSKGRGVKASNAPMSEFRAKENERIGHYWMQTTVGRGRSPTRLIQGDVNYWKTQAYRKLKMGRGDKGGLTVFGRPHEHPLLSAHVRSEKPQAMRSESTGRVVWEWSLIKGRDNHFWDCLVGCLIAASYSGVVVGQAQPATVKRQRKSLAEMAANARRK